MVLLSAEAPEISRYLAARKSTREIADILQIDHGLVVARANNNMPMGPHLGLGEKIDDVHPTTGDLRLAAGMVIRLDAKLMTMIGWSPGTKIRWDVRDRGVEFRRFLGEPFCAVRQHCGLMTVQQSGIELHSIAHQLRWQPKERLVWASLTTGVVRVCRLRK